MDFFRNRKTPEQVINLLSKALQELTATEDERVTAKLREEIAKRVNQAKAFIYGESDGKDDASSSGSNHGSGSSDRAKEVAELARAIMAHEIMPAMLTLLKRVDFETRKSIATIFVHVLRYDTAGFASEYMPHHAQLMFQMVDGYSSSDAALTCGLMLRECIKVPALEEELLIGPDGGLSVPLRRLFEEHVFNPSFEVAVDAFETLTAALTSNKALVFRTFNPEEPASLQQ